MRVERKNTILNIIVRARYVIMLKSIVLRLNFIEHLIKVLSSAC